jgi:hypothetical protein
MQTLIYYLFLAAIVILKFFIPVTALEQELVRTTLGNL